MENAGSVSTVEQLEKENEKLRQIILIQNTTINRLIDRYILKKISKTMGLPGIPKMTYRKAPLLS